MRLAAHKETGATLLAAINRGTQAEHHPHLRAGLVVTAVAGVSTEGISYADVLGMVKSGNRPLTITLAAMSDISKKSPAVATQPIWAYRTGDPEPEPEPELVLELEPELEPMPAEEVVQVEVEQRVVSNHRRRLIAIYEAHSPSKLKDVEELLQEWNGEEDELLAAVEAKYAAHRRAEVDDGPFDDWPIVVPEDAKVEQSRVDVGGGLGARAVSAQLDSLRALDKPPRCLCEFFVRGERFLGYWRFGVMGFLLLEW
jgi:hypothetical protein